MITAPGSLQPGTTYVILAGGSSRRFGTDKALAIVPESGMTMLQTMVRIGTETCDKILIVGERRAAIEDRGVLWIADRYPGEGPLAGLVSVGGTGLVGRAVIVGVDQPYLTSTLLQHLLITNSSYMTFPVCFSESGVVHPLPVALDFLSVAPRLETAFMTGERSLRTALLGVGMQSIPAAAGELALLTDVDRPTDFLDTVNTVTDG